MQGIFLQRVSKIYPNGTQALREVTLLIPAEKIFVFVGPSGSGKSTLLHIIAGLLSPSAGQVFFKEREVTTLPAEQRNVGMVFQSYMLFPHMTVEENVAFGLKVRHVSLAEQRKRIAEILDLLKISHLARRYPAQLSGGEQQRVALARAVVFQPDILLLDEPLSALDAQLREVLRTELRALLRHFGLTTLYVTHDREEAMSLGDQLAVMRKGEIIQVGTPAEIYQKPADPFVASFIGKTNIYKGLATWCNAQEVGVQFSFGELALPRALFRQQEKNMRGQTLECMIRPEDIQVACSETPPHGMIEVTDVSFLGNRQQITGKTSKGEPLILEGRNDILVKPGELLPIQIQIKNIHCFPSKPHGH